VQQRCNGLNGKAEIARKNPVWAHEQIALVHKQNGTIVVGDRSMGWGRNLVWLISYEPDTPIAILSLIVSSIYAICQLGLLLRSGATLSLRKMRWSLPAAVLYAVVMATAANWPGIWGWCFKLRYGT
jgi:hypothetical protein